MKPYSIFQSICSFVRNMNKKRCAKWKTITAYNESAKEVIHYELDENEKLIIKNKIQKKVPNIIKQISLNNK